MVFLNAVSEHVRLVISFIVVFNTFMYATCTSHQASYTEQQKSIKLVPKGPVISTIETVTYHLAKYLIQL